MINQKVLDSIAHLSPEKRELVLKKLQQKKQQQKERRIEQNSEIKIINREERITLSLAQEWLWKSDQIDSSASNIYNLCKILRFRGQLDVTILEKAFNEMVKRHEILRTSFNTFDNQPLQQIADTLNLFIPVIDLQHLSGKEQNMELERLFHQQKEQLFDLTKTPLLKTTLLRLETEYYALLLTIHHIIIDGWSLGILIKELLSLYSSFSQNQPSTLPELPLQYADFAHWQRQQLTGEKLTAQLNYWQQQLKDAPPLLELPTDRPRISAPSFRGETEQFELSSHLLEQLKILSQKLGTTLYITLLSAFSILLSHYSNQEDLVIGSAIANRNKSELEPLIGLFANTLPLRIKLDNDSSFSQLLQKVSSTVMDAYAHPDITIEKLLQTLDLKTNPSYPPLFQVVFVLQNAPMETFKLPNLELEPIQLEGIGAHFDLILAVKETESGLKGVWEYNPDLFDCLTIQRMMRHWQNLLSSIVNNPQQSITQLPLLSESEKHQLLVEWNNTKTPVTPEYSLHQLFEEQVKKNPHRIAVVFQDQKLTYEQLNERANQLANYLRKQGVKPETLVGLFLERSLEMIIAILGILKAGGAYVPLDINYPEERLAYMLSDSQVSIVLTQESLSSNLPENQARLIYVDTDTENIEKESSENLTTTINLDNLAYVIYTSGSTGKPKGVLITHQGLGNLILAQSKTFGVDRDSRVLQFASSSFDASVSEIGMALGTGATLYLETPENLLPSLDLIKLLQKEAITHVTFPPSVLAALPDAELPDLITIIVAGEACSPQLRTKWSQGRKFFNAYGPTEVTVCATIADLSDESETFSIGRPINNTQVYILDSYLQPLPVGIPGEIYVGGMGLARGYLNQPELTASKFIANHFSNESNSRLYKTGDLGRYLPDGKIEFLGRVDNQVKIRGFRIELGEIESVLSENRKIKQVAVISNKNTAGDNYLEAYIVPAQAQPPSNNELRYFLKQKLPEYMIPSTFEMLEAMPLNSNGKIDKQALSIRKKSTFEDDSNFIPPHTETEKILAQIWSEVLDLKKVGIRDNFFELGGDSIRSMQVITKANQLGLHFTAKQLLEHQTIAELSTVVGAANSLKAEQGIVTGIVPLLPIQKWFFEQNISPLESFKHSHLLQVSSEVQIEALQSAIKKILLHHDALRMTFRPLELGWQQFNPDFDQQIPLLVKDLSNLTRESEEECLKKTELELQSKLKLDHEVALRDRGHLIQFALFKRGYAQNHLLLIMVHHLVIDGVSWDILLQDLSTVYEQIVKGETINLPPKTTSFKDWAVRLETYAQSDSQKKELKYWLKQVNSNMSLLPVDYRKPQKKSSIPLIEQISVSLDSEKTLVLFKKVLSNYKAQINDVLLTALVQTLRKWTGEQTLLIDIESHGREPLFDDIDLSRTIGWFTSVYPVWLQIETDNEDIGRTLTSIKEQLRRIPNKGIGYGLLRYLNQDQNIRSQLQATPQAEINFNYLGQIDEISPSSIFLGLDNNFNDLRENSLKHISHLLEVDGFVKEEKLQFVWKYKGNLYDKSTIEKLSSWFIRDLINLIEYGQSNDSVGYTASDFALAGLDEKQFSELSELLDKID